MVEPTESEDLQELDKFCDAVLLIRKEIDGIGSGCSQHKDSPLHHALHTIEDLDSDTWDRPYSIENACPPVPWIKVNKFWLTYGRVANVYVDRKHH